MSVKAMKRTSLVLAAVLGIGVLLAGCTQPQETTGPGGGTNTTGGGFGGSLDNETTMGNETSKGNETGTMGQGSP